MNVDQCRPDNNNVYGNYFLYPLLERFLVGKEIRMLRMRCWFVRIGVDGTLTLFALVGLASSGTYACFVTDGLSTVSASYLVIVQGRNKNNNKNMHICPTVVCRLHLLCA